MTQLDSKFLELLECPISHRPLVQVGDWLYSTDRDAPRRYPIRDGIPDLLVETAEPVSGDEFQRIMVEIGRTGPSE